MKGITSDLLERNVSINRLFTHIEEVSDQRGKIEVVVVLKASFFVALYNNIEATAYATLEKVCSGLMIPDTHLGENTAR